MFARVRTGFRWGAIVAALALLTAAFLPLTPDCRRG